MEEQAKFLAHQKVNITRRHNSCQPLGKTSIAVVATRTSKFGATQSSKKREREKEKRERKRREREREREKEKERGGERENEREREREREKRGPRSTTSD